MPPPSSGLALEVRPATPERWGDLERLFGERGAYGGCWCMWWRLKRSEFAAQSADERRRGLRALVERGEVPGLLAYAGDEPVGWCSLGPRAAYPPLGRSRTLKPVDDEPVWSIVCFFVARPYRRRGVQAALIKAAVAYAAERGARIVEAYPDGDYMGGEAAFRAAGFEEVARRSPTRPLLRRVLPDSGA